MLLKLYGLREEVMREHGRWKLLLPSLTRCCQQTKGNHCNCGNTKIQNLTKLSSLASSLSHIYTFNPRLKMADSNFQQDVAHKQGATIGHKKIKIGFKLISPLADFHPRWRLLNYHLTQDVEVTIYGNNCTQQIKCS